MCGIGKHLENRLTQFRFVDDLTSLLFRYRKSLSNSFNTFSERTKFERRKKIRTPDDVDRFGTKCARNKRFSECAAGLLFAFATLETRTKVYDASQSGKIKFLPLETCDTAAAGRPPRRTSSTVFRNGRPERVPVEAQIE